MYYKNICLFPLTSVQKYARGTFDLILRSFYRVFWHFPSFAWHYRERDQYLVLLFHQSWCLHHSRLLELLLLVGSFAAQMISFPSFLPSFALRFVLLQSLYHVC